MTGTPWVSRYSRVRGISRMDFMPAQTTATLVRANSIKSPDISMVFSLPRCTPPIPPVTNIEIPAILAHIIVAATVVPPSWFCKIANGKSLLLTFTVFIPRANCSSSNLLNPIFIRPSMTAIVAGIAPSLRIIFST